MSSLKTRLAIGSAAIALALAGPASAQHRAQPRRANPPASTAPADTSASGATSDGAASGTSTTTAGGTTDSSTAQYAPRSSTGAAGSSAPPGGSEAPPGVGPLSSDEAVGEAHGPPPPPPGTDPSLLLERHGVEMSIGARVWVMHIPSFIVSLFAHVEPGWGGSLGVAVGPEFVYRNNGLDIVIGVMYVGYGAGNGFFRGVNEGPTATEQVNSNLFGLYLTSHFMWGIRFARQFEFQIGAGIGVGYIGGDLYRSQAYESPAGSWHDCMSPGLGTGGYCGSDNRHYSSFNYTEPGIFSNGSVPTLIPWISLPQVAFHIRPHRNFDFKIEGGFALIGFYGGASLHYVF